MPDGQLGEAGRQVGSGQTSQVPACDGQLLHTLQLTQVVCAVQAGAGDLAGGAGAGQVGGEGGAPVVPLSQGGEGGQHSEEEGEELHPENTWLNLSSFVRSSSAE